MRRLEYPWQKSYCEAILEPDPEKLGALIEKASRDIENRKREIVQLGVSAEERQAIEDALSNLRILRKEFLAANR